MIRFGIRFLLAFALLASAFEASRGTGFERFVVERLTLAPVTMLINRITPTEQVRLTGRTLLCAHGSSLRVTRGCEGIELLLLLVAAVLAFPACWEARWRGLAIGCALTYLLSLARLLALHYTLRYSPTAWNLLHGLILPLAPIALIMLYFLRWSASASGPAAPLAPDAAIA